MMEAQTRPKLVDPAEIAERVCINCMYADVKVVPGPDGLKTHCHCRLSEIRVDMRMVGCKFWRMPTR